MRDCNLTTKVEFIGGPRDGETTTVAAERRPFYGTNRILAPASDRIEVPGGAYHAQRITRHQPGGLTIAYAFVWGPDCTLEHPGS